MRGFPWRMAVPLLLAIPAAAGRADTPSTRTAAVVTLAPPLFGSEAVERARAGSRSILASDRPAWIAFLRAHPGPWRADWDARAGTPRQIWGGSFPIVPADAGAAVVEAAVRRLLAGEFATFARVPDDRLRTSVLRKRGDTWFVRFDRLALEGAPVAGAYAEARITSGQLVLLRIETHPGAEEAAARRIDAAHAILLAEDALRPLRELVGSDATAVIAPIASGPTWTYRPAWEVVTRASSGEVWRTRVDAVYGELLARHSLTPSLSGRVTAMVEPRTVGETLVEQALPHVIVSTTAASTAVATSDGTWTLAEPAPLSMELTLTGTYVHVEHQLVDDGFAEFVALDGASDFAWMTDEATQAEIAAYRHASTVRDWAAALAPTVSWLHDQLTVHVGLPSQCNALWDGTIVLYGEGADCNDTARIADVVYHEYGHGFHQHIRISGVLDASIGEGIGDYVAATINGSPRIGVGLLKAGPGDGALRDVEEDLVYPDDLTGEIHADGLIFAGAMWDTRTALIAIHGDALGRAKADQLFTKIVETGPTFDQVFVEALLADDDDANLANGTPNRCLLEVAFGHHGLAGASGLFSLAHTEVTGPVDANAEVEISATRPMGAALCATSEIAAVTLHWFVGTDSVSSASMTPAGDSFASTITNASGNVRYWFESTLQSGETVFTPPRSPVNTFGFHAGPLEVVWFDDFESAPSEWTSGGVNDDWQIGVPQGLGGDPADAYSGANVIGNRLDGDGMYASASDNWIESPPIDCRRCKDAILQFRRYGVVQQAVSDRVTAGIGTIPVWQNELGIVFDETSVHDPIWSFQEYDVSELADGGANIRIRFTLVSDNFLQFGGLTLDDVAIVMPAGGGPDGDIGGGGCGCSLAPKSGAAPAAGVFLLLSFGVVWIRAIRRWR